MTEATSSTSEPSTGPVATGTPPPPPPSYVEREPDREPRRGRVTAVAAWVGIVAGVVFIVAVVFFSGFVLGAHSGGHHRGHDRDLAIIHRGGPPPMFPMGPRGEFERPPFGGPGFAPPQLPVPGGPTTTAPSRP